ncbi:MAG: hypothetical protein KC800_32950, partial [Candidatus Eremiobacteraeota bacterium]|nr:hypothetical protein [Candidatus Eremiobacteraeota bacterium]
MPSSSENRVHTLGDFAEFISAVNLEGFEFVVIGGCAVGAYSHLLNEACLTTDLDILTTPETVSEIVRWARSNHQLKLLKTPKPRSLQIAVMNWGDLEINVLTRSRGLPPASQAFQNARIFKLQSKDLLEVPIADPFDLLENKIQINREKDQPHIEILRAFIHEEIVSSFAQNASPRERLAPVRRLLRVQESRTLPQSLSERLIALARTPVDFRFLVNHVPTREQA